MNKEVAITITLKEYEELLIIKKKYEKYKEVIDKLKNKTKENLEKQNNQLKCNWNKLKEYLNYKSERVVGEYEYVYDEIYNEMQELEQGSDE